MVKDSALTDTYMFFLGMCVGVLINSIFSNIDETASKHQIVSLGLAQVLVNAFVIRYVQTRVNCIGLFSMGLISFQTLIIKKVLDE